MTLKLQILNGPRFVLWNVIDLNLRYNGATVIHSDRPPTEIPGFIEKIVRVKE